MAGLIGRNCEAAYPGGEGTVAAGKIGLSKAGLSGVLPIGAQFRGRRGVSLRLQLFPDGTCGVALDGRPLWRSRVSLLLDRPFAIVLGAGFSGTRVPPRPSSRSIR